MGVELQTGHSLGGFGNTLEEAGDLSILKGEVWGTASSHVLLEELKAHRGSVVGVEEGHKLCFIEISRYCNLGKFNDTLVHEVKLWDSKYLSDKASVS